jgi:RecB family endonuclease NucS
MLERDMENLIAAFPEEFFPGYRFVLTGRQQSFCGAGRFDLLFTDSYQTKVLMELKAVTAKYENATQLAKYKEALEARGECNILMWLVAPSVPSAVR